LVDGVVRIGEFINEASVHRMNKADKSANFSVGEIVNFRTLNSLGRDKNKH
jgi:hypothetical protein